MSTTHTTAGAVTGVGVAARGQAVSWVVARRLVVTWIVMLPAAGVTAAFIYAITRLPLPATATALTVLGLAGLALLHGAWRGAARVSDIAAEVEWRNRTAVA